MEFCARFGLKIWVNLCNLWMEWLFPKKSDSTILFKFQFKCSPAILSQHFHQIRHHLFQLAVQGSTAD